MTPKQLKDYDNEGKGMDGFFAFLWERYTIMLRRRDGLPAPWTNDLVLQAWRFCNVRREDDKTTVWFRENIRDPLKDHPSVLFATLAFRWFNTIETGEAIRPWLLGPWDREEVQKVLEDRMEKGHKLFTGAFMVNSAPGMPKYMNVLDNLDICRERLAKVHPCETMEAAFHNVFSLPRLGNFAAYQIVVDLQYTYLLRDAPDLNTFTVAGPGCAKGIGLCLYDDPKRFNYGSKVQQVQMIEIHREFLEYSRDPMVWPENWPPFVLSDIENGFCEYAKWRTGHEGSRLKRKYTQC